MTVQAKESIREVENRELHWKAAVLFMTLDIW